jgi:hypothetical protein
MISHVTVVKWLVDCSMSITEGDSQPFLILATMTRNSLRRRASSVLASCALVIPVCSPATATKEDSASSKSSVESAARGSAEYGFRPDRPKMSASDALFRNGMKGERERQGIMNHRLSMWQYVVLVVRPQLSSPNPNFSKPSTRTANSDFWSGLTHQLLKIEIHNY